MLAPMRPSPFSTLLVLVGCGGDPPPSPVQPTPPAPAVAPPPVVTADATIAAGLLDDSLAAQPLTNLKEEAKPSWRDRSRGIKNKDADEAPAKAGGPRSIVDVVAELGRSSTFADPSRLTPRIPRAESKLPPFPKLGVWMSLYARARADPA